MNSLLGGDLRWLSGRADSSAEDLLVEIMEGGVIAREDHDRLYRWSKRLLDLALCGLLLLITLPLFLLIPMAIKLDSPGPALFWQERTGKNGSRFRMAKFRTMRRDSEEIKKKLLRLSHLHYPDFKIREDPRLTRVGRFLRRVSLDELPNLLNVLRGEMSLVGPRPTSFEAGKYKEWHRCRLLATPGVTGLQQVTGRADLQFDERVLLDAEYVRRQSLLLDLRILLRTVRVVLSMKGSY